MPTSQERSEKNLHEQEDKREGNYRFSDTACGVSPLALFTSLGFASQYNNNTCII